MLQLVYTVILARLLGPEPFGLVAAAWAVIGLTTLVGSFGFGPIRDRYLDSFRKYIEEFEDSCLTYNLDYFRISTSQPLANALAAYLHKRELFR